MSKPLPAESNGQVHPADTRRTVIGLGLIAFAVLVTYGNTLKSEFIHDDTAEILQNPFVRDLSHIREIFTSAAWTFGGAGPYQLSSNYYRPIQYLSYAVLYRFFGPEPWGYHLYKLLSHLAVCGLVFWILWRWWQDYQLALFSSLLFAVHPANTEAVSWVSGIGHNLCIVLSAKPSCLPAGPVSALKSAAASALIPFSTGHVVQGDNGNVSRCNSCSRMAGDWKISKAQEPDKSVRSLARDVCGLFGSAD
jgi:hypothetical protein